MKLFVNARTLSFNYPLRQSGAVLLAFMLIMIAASSYFLVNKLNTNIRITTGVKETRAALHLAKQALIGYAVSYPDKVNTEEGPGYLPCPDRDNDGDAEGNCSNNAPNYTTIGRLPYKTLELAELRDNSGQRLWYILSENFRYGNNKIVPLNSESPAQADLSLNTTSDIVAVIIAPGAPVGAQSRDPADNNIINEISHYLEDDNNNLDTTFVSSAAGEFNDIVIAITRAELMRAVEKRVLGEVSQFMTNYYNDHGAYPWLTPYADPKATNRGLRGVHNGGNNASDLTDNSVGRDFTDWGVAAGDVVRNITDGSIGTVTAVTANTLTIGGGLSFGTDNNFDNNDKYAVYLNSLANRLTGTATSGSSGLVLEDTNRDFVELGVAAGDIVENITDSSNGMVQSVSTNQITVKSISAGAFDNNDVYQIRSNTGTHTTAANPTILTDDNKDFLVMGVQAGDIIINNTDSSLGRITLVASNTLTVDQLYFGVDNEFDTGDVYSIPRYVTDNATREGLLSFHEPGKYSRTGFTFDWNITAANNATIATNVNAGSPDVAYQAGISSHVEGVLGSVTVDFSEGQCIWLVEQVVDCFGISEDIFLQGTVTAGVNSVNLIDTTKNFNTYGVKPGDIIQNYDDATFVLSGTATAGSGELLLVDNVTNFLPSKPAAHNNFVITKNGDVNTIAIVEEIVDNDTVRLKAAPADTNITFAAGDSWEAWRPQRLVVASVTANDTLLTVQTNATVPDFDGALDEYYRILTATGNLAGVADGASSGSTLQDTTADFSNIEVGDIVENTTDGSFGRITNVVSTTELVATLYLPSDPATSTTTDFDVGDNYIIHYDYVGKRRYEIEVVYSGIARVYTDNEVRKRDVCIGYEDAGNPACTVAAVIQADTLTPNNGIATVSITDLLDITENTAATATVTVNNITTGSIKTTGLDYHLFETGQELPDWFVENNWHQLIYVTYSTGDEPNAASACTPGTDCIVLEQTNEFGNTLSNNAVRAMVFMAGEETQTIRDSACSAVAAVNQVRSNATLNEYFELKNCDSGDDEFQQVKLPTNLNFNDQVKIIN